MLQSAPPKDFSKVPRPYYPSTQYGQDTRQSSALTKIPHEKQVEIFSHLPQFEKITSLGLDLSFNGSKTIPSYIISLGFKYSNSLIIGSNARCVAFLKVIERFISEFQYDEIEPDNQVFLNNLYKSFNQIVQFLEAFRPFSTSMKSAASFSRKCLANPAFLDKKIPRIKESLVANLKTFLDRRILRADEIIADSCVQKIYDGDVILTHSSSSVVERTFIQANDLGIDFRVIIVDSRPLQEGKRMLKKLTKRGIDCSYCLSNAVTYIMKDVTKIILGAHSMLSNGNLVSRVGTALLCCVAKSFSKPVIVLCETYKFSRLSSIDSVDINELGDPEEIVSTLRIPTRTRIIPPAGDSTTPRTKKSNSKTSPKSKKTFEMNSDVKTPLEDWKSHPNIRILNIRYDVTPKEFITMLVTEIGNIPPTSVPVILKEIESEIYGSTPNTNFAPGSLT